MEPSKNAYKQILKATSLFGGVQFISIFSSIIKTKITALLIGVSGVGIFGILNSTLSFVQSIARFGLDVTAVKEIASSNTKEVDLKINLVIKLSLFTGVIGAIIALIFSPILSQLAFGNKDYTLFFVIISLAILFSQLSVGNLAILQGLKHLKNLAKAITLSSIITVFPVIAIYYFYGESGIPWVIVTTALIGYLASIYYMRQIKVKKVSTSFTYFFNEGKSTLKSGFYLSMASVVNMCVGFIIQIFITNTGGVTEAGYYNAGFLIINSYVSVFFSALSKDYFPRLVEVSKTNELVNSTVNNQSYILLLLITPLVIIFLIFKSVIVSLLFSSEFLPIVGMITYGILATVFKAVSWSMGFVLLAKGNTKLYLLTEIISYSALLLSIVIGYNINGLTGLGIGFLLYHILDLVFIKYVVSKKFRFKFDNSFNKLFYLCIIQFSIMLSLIYIGNDILRYILMMLVALFSVYISVKKLHKHIDLKEVLHKFFKK